MILEYDEVKRMIQIEKAQQTHKREKIPYRINMKNFLRREKGKKKREGINFINFFYPDFSKNSENQ